ncbi:MAG: hypothetical protein A2710_24360 [Burkholderiales bacterium RIFCSPHIGHO2_01_FULL_64_960]|nr:MAG: hypothetical protein A2710_24360 [Burkholderiales bacterium RIFCSPHIGHO2_01_FULL_64_960]
MSSNAAEQYNKEGVLESFALEREINAATLKRYLSNYPDLAIELVDLSRELTAVVEFDEGPLSEDDQRRIASATTRLLVAPGAAKDLLAELTVPQLRQIAGTLGVPRQILVALRERSTSLASIPSRFLSRLASEIGCSADQLKASLNLPAPAIAGSFKSDSKPAQTDQVSFEQILREAGLSDDQIAALMEDGS